MNDKHSLGIGELKDRFLKSSNIFRPNGAQIRQKLPRSTMTECAKDSSNLIFFVVLSPGLVWIKWNPIECYSIGVSSI